MRELVNVSESALADQEVETGFPGQTATIVREPFGVILGIAPSNAPIALAARAVTEAILAGNTCVLKTSEVSPTGNMVISQIFAEAGLPAGVLNVVHASTKDTPSVVEALIGNPLVRCAASICFEGCISLPLIMQIPPALYHRLTIPRKVNFTGSTRVGAIIASLAGKYLKPTVLELGGAAILLALEDADVEDAAKNAVFGGFLHSGQICMATNNVLGESHRASMSAASHILAQDFALLVRSWTNTTQHFHLYSSSRIHRRRLRCRSPEGDGQHKSWFKP